MKLITAFLLLVAVLGTFLTLKSEGVGRVLGTSIKDQGIIMFEADDVVTAVELSVEGSNFVLDCKGDLEALDVYLNSCVLADFNGGRTSGILANISSETYENLDVTAVLVNKEGATVKGRVYIKY